MEQACSNQHTHMQQLQGNLLTQANKRSRVLYKKIARQTVRQKDDWAHTQVVLTSVRVQMVNCLTFLVGEKEDCASTPFEIVLWLHTT